MSEVKVLKGGDAAGSGGEGYSTRDAFKRHNTHDGTNKYTGERADGKGGIE